MNIYHYHPITNQFLGIGQADPDPLNAGEFLQPAHSTSVSPPNVGAGFVAKFVGGEWLTEAIPVPEIPPEPTPPTAAEIKAVMWQKIKAERERREGGGYLVGTTWYHSDPASLMKYNTLLSMAIEKSLPANTPLSAAWKDMAGGFAPMTVALLRLIRDVGVAKVSQIYTAAETHNAAMNASATPETYNYLTGWPVIYGE